VSGVLTGYKHWGARLGMIGPIWLIMKLFGESEISSYIYPMSMSFATIVLIFFVCKRHFDPATGIVASFLYVFLPQDINLSGLMYPDVPVVFFGFLFMYLSADIAIKGRYAPVHALITGIVLGLGYYVRETSILLLIILPVLFVMADNRRAYIKNCIFILIGFGFAIILERIMFWILADDPLNRFHLLLNKTKVLAPRRFTSYGPDYGQGQDLIRKYLLDPILVLFGTYWVSPLMIIFVFAGMVLIMTQYKNMFNNLLRNRYFMAWAIIVVIVLGYFTYGPVYGLTVPLKREVRYYHVVMPALSIVTAAMLYEMIKTKGLTISVSWVLIFIYVMMSLICIASIKNKNSDGIEPVSNFITTHSASKYVLPENWAMLLKLKQGDNYPEQKIITYKYIRRPAVNDRMIQGLIEELSKSKGKKYVFVAPSLHEIQVGFWRHIKWPVGKMHLEDVVSSRPVITCTMLQRLKNVWPLIPGAIKSRLCYKTDVYIYSVLSEES
jgi:hypothetical protein